MSDATLSEKVIDAAVAYVESRLARENCHRLYPALEATVTAYMAEKVGGWTATTTEKKPR